MKEHKAIQRRIDSREQRINQLIAACDSIKENAKDFIGNEPIPVRWQISIVFEPRESPVVRLERESVPRFIFERQDVCL